MTAALEGGEWSASPPGKDWVPILQEAGWAPGPVWTGGKSRPHRDSIPDLPARSQSLYRLSCISTPIEKWTHRYMNLFTRNSPYYHLLKYLLLLKKTLCIHTHTHTHTHTYIYIYIYIYIYMLKYCIDLVSASSEFSAIFIFNIKGL